MTRTRPCMIWLIAFVLSLASSPAHADGTYHVGRDSRGMYFQTDRDGGWQIPREDQKLFRVGESGAYSKGSDAGGTYIRIDEGRKFYLDVSARGAGAQAQRPDPGKNASASAKETKVTVKGNQVLVPVVLGYRGREVQVSLLLDTGASITTLNRDAVKRLQLTQARKAKLIVPGGRTIDTDVVQLSYIKVGPHKIADLHAGVIDHKGISVDYQGLLGMNFLKEVDYKIDFQREVIVWR